MTWQASPLYLGIYGWREALEEIEITCADGFPLSSRLYRPEGAPKLAVLISSGTGFPQQYYRHLAAFLMARGAVVLTYDYRGIAGSALEDWPTAIDLPDWGRLDMDAAVRALARVAPKVPIAHIGHSAGGHLVGFAAHHGLVSRHAFVCVGSGTWYRHWVSRWPLELYFWWVLGPISIWRTGRVGGAGGWRGAALPPKVFRTWRRWSHRASYYGRELRRGLQPHHFEACTAPIRSWVFPDDGIATPATAQDILNCFPNAETEILVRAPSFYGLPRIGHQGAFKQGCEAIWEEWWAWLASDAHK